MGRRLKQRELTGIMVAASAQLREELAQRPLPSAELDRETYLEQTRTRQLVMGRWMGVSDALDLVLEHERWGPVAQARVHDALLEKMNILWAQRAQQMAENARQGAARGRDDEDVLLLHETGRIDALRASSAALAGFPEQLQALPDVMHPDRARQPMRVRRRERGRDRGLE